MLRSFQEALISFYASLPVSRVSDLRKLATNLASVFGSTCTCEQAFSRMEHNKSKLRSRITCVNLHDVMRTGISNVEPNVNSLAEQRQAQFRINEVSLGCLYCNVQFRVGYGINILG
jgi:hypothetical protein